MIGTPQETTEAQLWMAFQAGDRAAFEQIYSTTIGFLTNYAMRVVSDKQLVQDAIQDIFVELWNKRENLGKVNSIRFYLMKAVRRDLIRKKIKQDKNTPMDLFRRSVTEFQPSYEMMKVKDEESSEKILKMKAMIEQLTPRQKEVLYLKYFSNLTNNEIAEILEINVQSVYNNIYRALEVLRDKMHVFVPWYLLEVCEPFGY
ncbi:RNA polymerase sigma factor [Marinoscillum furvescens]|nr:sigma-70 family RNA polymerase sigma factor [Marinoscillum furvescens]